MRRSGFLLLCCLWLAACATNPPVQRSAAAQGFAQVDIPASGFVLRSYQRVTDATQPLHIYIEGDGRAWLSTARPSADPTPQHAVALILAAADPAANVIYLARPCQYNMSPVCSVTYWTDKRFSREVVDAMELALDQLVQKAPGQPVHLTGYSGGAAIAALLAARRHDIASLTTVAGNLDHVELNAYHHVSAMPESLNAIDIAPQLKNMPQRHFIGGRDKVVPPGIAERFIERTGGQCARLLVVDEATHDQGWAERWQKLLETPFACL